MEKQTKQLAAVALGALALGGGVGAVLSPVEVEVPTADQATLDALAEAQAEVARLEALPPVEVPGPVQWRTEEVIVEVDNGNLALVLETIWDADGNVEYLVEGLDDDQLPEIVDRIVFESDAKALAEEAVKHSAIDELHREDVGTIELHREDMRGLKVDADLTTLDVFDYEDKDGEALVTVTFRQGSERFEAVFSVLIRDGEVDDLAVESVTQI